MTAQSITPGLRRTVGVASALAAVLALLWLDRAVPAAAGALLLVLTATLGIGHGATDVLLMRASWPHGARFLWAGVGYAAAVGLGVLLLLPHPALALALLLLLSVWHFGEGFERFAGQPALHRLALRLVFGGAPVLLPALLAAAPLRVSLEMIFAQSAATAMLLQFWTGLAMVWLAVCGVYAAWALLARTQTPPGAWRPWVYELGALVFLYLAFSPLMAAAIFFGVYHSGQHLRRVLRAGLGGAASLRALWGSRAVLATVGASLGLGAAVFALLGPQGTQLSLSAQALQTWVVFLTAVSVPHVLLISYASQHLLTRAR